MSGNYLAVAWLGRDDNKPTRLTGASGALKVWTEFMGSAVPHSLEPLIPDNIEHVWIDRATGKLGAQACEGSVWVAMRAGEVPDEYSPCAAREAGWIKRWFN